MKNSYCNSVKKLTKNSVIIMNIINSQLTRYPTLPERISDLPIIERISSNHSNHIGQGDNEEGKVKEDNCVDEGIEGEGEQNHKQST